MKNKKDVSEIIGLAIVIIASAYLGTSTLIAAFRYETGLFIISLVIFGIGVISGVEIIKELRK